jgi:hypothetical protein
MFSLYSKDSMRILWLLLNVFWINRGVISSSIHTLFACWTLPISKIVCKFLPHSRLEIWNSSWNPEWCRVRIS